MIRDGLPRAAIGLAVAAMVLATEPWLPSPAPALVAFGRPAGPVAGTPCTARARACVDLSTRRAWLIRDGVVSLGPVPISPGGPGEETPAGTFRVWRKDLHHVSMEQRGIPMPFSVFFDKGVAFHQGPLSLLSAGCVHLRPSDASVFYRALRVGDQVQVRPVHHRASPSVRPGRSVPLPALGPGRSVRLPVARPARSVPLPSPGVIAR